MQKNLNNLYIMIESSLLLEKAKKYVVCFSSECPLHEHCLRWHVGQVHSDSVRLQTVVNPHYPKHCNDHCDYFRNDTPVRVGIGMVNFYHDMPHYQELAIKKHIIQHFCRTRYYRMRGGEIPITPDDQELIARICRYHGWNAEPRYDRYEEQYLW